MSERRKRKAARRVKVKAGKRAKGPVSAHKADSREAYYAMKRRPRQSDSIGPCWVSQRSAVTPTVLNDPPPFRLGTPAEPVDRPPHPLAR